MSNTLGPTLCCLFIALSVTGLGVLAYLRKTSPQQRKMTWMRFFRRHNFRDTTEDPSLLKPYEDFEGCSGGTISRIVSGTYKGATIHLVEYHFQTDGAGSSRSVCIVEHASLRLPHFRIRKQSSFLDAIGLGEVMNGQDIVFNDDKIFCERFVVQGEQEAITRRFFNKSRRQFFCEHPLAYMALEGRGPAYVFHQHTNMTPRNVQSFLDLSTLWLGVLGEGSPDRPSRS